MEWLAVLLGRVAPRASHFGRSGFSARTERGALPCLQSMLAALCCTATFAAEPFEGSAKQASHPIDLPAALRLAGAQNLDVQIARQRLVEARANHTGALLQFVPTISPGAGFRRHEGRLQDVIGNILDTDKQSYSAGGSLSAQWDLGEAIYKSLASKQLVRAADQAVIAQRQESALAAAHAYFDLSFAHLAIAATDDALRISRDYEAQVRQAVEAGITFKGDALRVQIEIERNQIARRQLVEQSGLSSARLAQIVHLDPSVQLTILEAELLPLDLIATNSSLTALTEEALAHRSELAQNEALVAAARETRNAATYGPLIPSLGAQAFAGGLGGGRDEAWGKFGRSEDYAVTLGWKIGPGGLFDSSRKKSAEARLAIATLTQAKAREEVARQVSDGWTRTRSLRDQIAFTQRALTTAESNLRLTQQRKEFGVGIVLETIQAEQDLTRIRLEHLRAIAEFNKSQYALQRAIGGL